MTPFQKIDDGLVITLTKGVYRQTDLYRRGASVYAQHGSGFIRLYRHGGTSLPSTSWKDMDPGAANITEDSFALVIKVPKSRKVEVPHAAE